MRKIAFFLLVGSMLAVTARAGDGGLTSEDNWPHWRGPQANGTVPKGDPPVVWDENKNIKWKAPLSGKGSATPIVWGDQVFVLTAIETDRVAKADDLHKQDPSFQKKTTAPTNF